MKSHAGNMREYYSHAEDHLSDLFYVYEKEKDILLPADPDHSENHLDHPAGE